MNHEELINVTAKEHGIEDTSYFADITLPMYAIIELMAKARQNGFEDGIRAMQEDNYPDF